MAAIYDYQGVVEAVTEVQTFSSGFCKRELVLTDDADTPSRYPNHIAFTFKKDNCSLLDNVQAGQRAKVRFAIDGRVWQDPKTGKNKYFTDLTALKFEIVNGDGTSTEPVATAVPPPAQAPASVSDVAAGDPDDLPF